MALSAPEAPFRRRLRLPRQCLLVAVPLLVGPACAPKVLKFEVTPSHVCARTPVKLDMQVVGTPSVTINPPLTEQAGHTYVPITTTHFVLSVLRWPHKPCGSEAEVKVMPGNPAEPDEITASVACETDKLIGTVPRPPAEWDPRLKVTTVESGEDREVLVTHEGRSARLTPASPTTNAFDGTSPGGDWTLSSPLKAAERCEANRPPPNLLNVAAQMRCGN